MLDKNKLLIGGIVIIFIIIAIVLLIIYRNNLDTFKQDKLDVNDLTIIYRDKEKRNLIDDLLKNKKQYFTEDEIKALKNKYQFFDKDKNITIDVLKLQPEKYPVGEENDIGIIQTINTNPSYNVILNKFNELRDLDYSDVEFLNNKDQNYYYYDIYGNKIMASMKDYFADYLTNIDEKNPKVCRPVEIKKGESGMIIPDMYPLWKYQTNAYNIDWSRIQNPLTIY